MNRQAREDGGKGQRNLRDEERKAFTEGCEPPTEALTRMAASSIVGLEDTGVSFPGVGISAELPESTSMPPSDWAGTTTVMMRNIPNKYTQRMLLTEINQTRFLGTFDFLYLPIDPETNANRGYCFLNFIDPNFAWTFKMAYEGRKMNKFNSSKVVSVTPATLQGFEANYAHYSCARVNRGDPACRPLFLREPKSAAEVVGKGGGGSAGFRRGGGKGRKGGGRIGMDQGTYMKSFGGMGSQNCWLSGDVSGTAGTTRMYLGIDSGTATVEAPPFVMEEGNAASSNPEASHNPIPRFCPHCGGPIQPSFQFCPNCGATLDFSMVGRQG